MSLKNEEQESVASSKNLENNGSPILTVTSVGSAKSNNLIM
jgi:hypothetical protein